LPRVPSTHPIYSDAGNTPSRVLGSPIRTPSDHSSVGSSPRLIAASYVLHRLLVPRHPPCALTHLHSTQQLKMLASTVQFSNNTHRPHPHPPHGEHIGNQCHQKQPRTPTGARRCCFRHPTVCFVRTPLPPGAAPEPPPLVPRRPPARPVRPPPPPPAGPQPPPRHHHGSYAIVFHPMSHPAHHTRARTGRKL